MDNQKKIALIFGIGGQDGSYMADLLLEKNYEVHGVIRRSSNFNTQRIEHIFHKLKLHYGDLTDPISVLSIISKVHPVEIYNFAAQSHVKVSSELENYTFQTNTIGVLNILQSVRTLNMTKTCRIYQASTSEIYGNTTDGTVLLNEESKQTPVSVYGISKMAAEHLCNMYRDAYGMFVVNSLLFNHEGPRRGHTFVTQKIANYVGKYANINDVIIPLQLGNLNARRDWGNAKDYVEAVYKMLQQDQPQNFVIATGETHSVREFVELAFNEIGIQIKWEGKGLEEKGYNILNGTLLVEVNPKYYRDIDIECLIGDASKAKDVLHWEPKTSFKELVKEMVQSALMNSKSSS
jgi:GDPmannose 4,6-dehydratase